MLKFYKNFAKTFVDDIIIFSRILTKHFIYLTQIFEFFRNKRINLSFIKLFIDYFSITLFN